MQGGSGNSDHAADVPASDDAPTSASEHTAPSDTTEPEQADLDADLDADLEADPGTDLWAASEPERVVETDAPQVPAEGSEPSQGSEGSDVLAAAAATPVPVDPSLPRHDAAPPPPMAAVAEQPQRGAETWYRTDQDRYKSVHRRANPWYRRLARGLIGLSFVAAAGVGLYFGATALQDYLDRDKLPDQGVDLPNVRSTTIQFSSTAPAPQVEGTLTLDTSTRAFEFIGTGAQAGTQVVSPDGTTLYVRRGSGNWRLAAATDTDVAALRRAIGYVADDDSADDILTSQLRRGYVDLEDRVEIGDGSDQLRQYDLTLDTRGFDLNFPLQYRQFQDNALPNVDEVRAHPVSIWLDDDSVLVRVEDLRTMWSWERLAYSDQPFTPQDPADSLLDQTIEITDGSLADDG